MKRWAWRAFEFLLGYTDLLFVLVGIAAWESYYRQPVSADTRWSLYVVLLLAISFRNWQKATARAEAAEAALEGAARKPATPARNFVEDPETLLAQLRDPKTLTRMQVVPYYDKWITIAGRVECAACAYVTLTLASGERVNVRFDASQESTLKDVRKGEYLTAVCQVRFSYSHSRVALENGEVVRLAPYRTLARVS